MSDMAVHFLGTNGWFPTETGNTTCLFLELPEAYVILDAGSGIRNVDRLILDERPLYLFLSHFHFDHITGLHILNKFDFRQGLTIVTYPGGKALLDSIICQPFTMPLKDLRVDIRFREIETGEQQGFPFGLRALELTHSSRCFGYRFESGGKTLAYCTDTGFCENALTLGRDADLLITECAYKPGQSVASWPHLNPEEAARLAKESGARRLAMMHFDAVNYQTFEKRDEAARVAREIFPESISTRDGQIIRI